MELVIGVDLITHDDLNGLERGMKGVSALLSIYAMGTVLLGTNVSKIGTKEALAYTAKTMVVDSSAQLTALGVQKIGERCDLPVAMTIILSFISGIVVSTKVDGIKIQGKNVSKKIDPPSGNVDKIKDAGIITEN
ncbi:MAG: pre-toxin TG domain-containing protein [Agathobacter sp.]|nr:pre-toxin TG domain-containing protein [Agathobacter sp.]